MTAASSLQQPGSRIEIARSDNRWRAQCMLRFARCASRRPGSGSAASAPRVSRWTGKHGAIIGEADEALVEGGVHSADSRNLLWMSKRCSSLHPAVFSGRIEAQSNCGFCARPMPSDRPRPRRPRRPLLRACVQPHRDAHRRARELRALTGYETHAILFGPRKKSG
jgi:hypothetical protein